MPALTPGTNTTITTSPLTPSQYDYSYGVSFIEMHVRAIVTVYHDHDAF